MQIDKPKEITGLTRYWVVEYESNGQTFKIRHDHTGDEGDSLRAWKLIRIEYTKIIDSGHKAIMYHVVSNAVNA